MTNQRVPAYPLIVNDPYRSVWSTHNRLTDGWSSHWTGSEQALCGLIRIDGVPYRFMGAQPRLMGDVRSTTRQSQCLHEARLDRLVCLPGRG